MVSSLEATINRNEPASETFLIERMPFERYVGEQPAVPTDPLLSLGPRKKVGRKRLNDEALREQLYEMEWKVLFRISKDLGERPYAAH